MKFISYLVFSLIFFISLNAGAQEQAIVDKDMLGVVHKQDFMQEPYVEWYEPEYQNYKLDTKTLYKIKDKMPEIKIKVFFGSWCGDSRREVPRFIKILDYLGIDYDNVEFIALDRNKSAPQYKKNIYNIKYVPTFIFFKGEKELGRIIESPEISLEKDMAKIVGG